MRQTRDQVAEGCRAYNRWLADLCSANPERHAGVALVTAVESAAARELADDLACTVHHRRAAAAAHRGAGLVHAVDAFAAGPAGAFRRAGVHVML